MPIPHALGERTARSCVGVRQLLAVDPEVEIVAAVADQPSLRQACDEEHPDVVLTDIRMPPTHTDEVAEIVELPLRHLLTDGVVTEELIEGPGWLLRAAVYRYAGHRIWGATARTLAMFASVLPEGEIHS